MADLSWRKSSISDNRGACVEIASSERQVHLRNSNHPADGTITVAGEAMSAWVAGVRAGEIDDLAG